MTSAHAYRQYNILYTQNYYINIVTQVNQLSKTWKLVPHDTL